MKTNFNLTESQLNRVILNTAKRLIREGYTDSEYYNSVIQNYVGKNLFALEEEFGDLDDIDEQRGECYVTKNRPAIGYWEWKVTFDPKTYKIISVQEI